MNAQELEEWLQGSASTDAGWLKNDGSGETVGHESGRKIVGILHKNPCKSADSYDEDDISHMRKVVSYWYFPLAYTGMLDHCSKTIVNVILHRKNMQSGTPIAKAISR
ncbi:hypothetical protein EDC01DRAFT_628683 [Geopyxis carbonaria]|nr:hypothetical protein EDC01DRAFT_628683 [Geopyxis carbonaria]